MKKLIYLTLLAGAMAAGTANAAEVFVNAGWRQAPRREYREDKDFRGHRDFRDYRDYREFRGHRPSPRHVWVEGYYRWDPRYRRNVWVRGYWVVPPPGYSVWVPGYWGYRGGVRIWIDGFWR